MDLVLDIDEEQCRRIGRALGSIRPRTSWFLPRLGGDATPDDEAVFWCLVIGICQQTRTARGVVDGVALRGSDYLIAAARRFRNACPAAFTPGAVRTWTITDFRKAFSDGGDPATCTLDRVEERLRLLSGIGRLLEAEGGGSFLELAERAGRRIGGPLGLAERLAAAEAYADPARKKTWLLVIFLRRLGIFEPSDPGAIGLPVDYHILRVALRSGAVLPGPELRRALVEGRPFEPAEDAAIRTVVSRAGSPIAEGGALDLFTLDNLLWMIGRNCCFYEHPPVCREPGPCPHRKTCSLIEGTDWDCPDRCPLHGVCRGSLDAAFAALVETRVETHWY